MHLHLVLFSRTLLLLLLGVEIYSFLLRWSSALLLTVTLCPRASLGCDWYWDLKINWLQGWFSYWHIWIFICPSYGVSVPLTATIHTSKSSNSPRNHCCDIIDTWVPVSHFRAIHVNETSHFTVWRPTTAVVVTDECLMTSFLQFKRESIKPRGGSFNIQSYSD